MASWFRALFRKQKLDREMDEEMRAHIEMRTRKNLEAGINPSEARYAALRSFGGMEQIKEICRDLRGVGWVDAFRQDLSFAARMLIRNPAFTAVAVATLALGIGANTAIFSAINALLLRPLPYRDSDQLVRIKENLPPYRGASRARRSHDSPEI